ncbi:MAG TPA: hydroxyphenylacetyl-CoA thioesterase PaaI [Steroidobacteraceae bacterium]|nr:hydroxyphenylacetyl-CoA thioesterase PaaI [Steroidobacteraceae bacterium]
MSDPQAVAEASASAMYAQDSASRALGMRIREIRPGYACLAMAVRADMVNGHEICHGGLIFTLADSAFAFACNTYDLVTVAASGSIEFLLPARLGDELIAIAEERSRSRRTGVYDVTVRNQRGESVAMFRGRSHEIGGAIVTKP